MSVIFRNEEQKDETRGIRYLAQRFINSTMSSAEKVLNACCRDIESSKSIINMRLGKVPSYASRKWHWEIKNFTLTWGLSQVNDYVKLWTISKSLKFCIKHIKSVVDVVANSVDVLDAVTGKAYPTAIPSDISRHYIDVLFSEPTEVCPNPPEVARVHFIIYAASLMEDKLMDSELKLPHKDERLPCTLVRVKYQFEGFKTWHSIESDRYNFQNEYIRFILKSKAKFFSNGLLN